MQFQFKIIPADSIEIVVPLVKKMSKESITEALLLERFKEMVSQNYECIGVYDADKLMGVSGLWFCTRHYSGRSVELDHVFIDDASNCRHGDFQSPALPTELPGHHSRVFVAHVNHYDVLVRAAD